MLCQISYPRTTLPNVTWKTVPSILDGMDSSVMVVAPLKTWETLVLKVIVMSVQFVSHLCFRLGTASEDQRKYDPVWSSLTICKDVGKHPHYACFDCSKNRSGTFCSSKRLRPLENLVPSGSSPSRLLVGIASFTTNGLHTIQPFWWLHIEMYGKRGDMSMLGFVAAVARGN